MNFDQFLFTQDLEMNTSSRSVGTPKKKKSLPRTLLISLDQPFKALPEQIESKLRGGTNTFVREASILPTRPHP